MVVAIGIYNLVRARQSQWKSRVISGSLPLPSICSMGGKHHRV